MNDNDARIDRRQFVALAGAGALAAATMKPATAQTAPAGFANVADLRFGFAPVPPAAPGFDPAGDAKALIKGGTPSPATEPIPGRQLFGSLAPGQRYVLRIPDRWNGNLVVAGTPATRSEFANDAIWGDYLLAHGYAYACSNKGIPYNAIVGPIAGGSPSASFPSPFNAADLVSKKMVFTFGALTPQKISIAKWNDDFAALTRVAKTLVRPKRTYAVGLSNGGAQVRSLLEAHPDLVDGGVEWSGVFWSPGLNLLTYMPQFLAAMPAYVRSNYTDSTARAAIIAAGYPADIVQDTAGHLSLWSEFYSGLPFYTDLTVFLYALLLDPQARSAIADEGCTPNPERPLTLPASCQGSGLALPENRATYRPSAECGDAIRAFSHSGKIGKPLISLAGTADTFVTPANNAAPYLAAVNAAGNGGRCWQYLVEGGTHVDTFAAFGYGLQPQLPFAWAALEQLVAVVERGAKPSGAGTAQRVSAPAQIGA